MTNSIFQFSNTILLILLVLVVAIIKINNRAKLIKNDSTIFLIAGAFYIFIDILSTYLMAFHDFKFESYFTYVVVFSQIIFVIQIIHSVETDKFVVWMNRLKELAYKFDPIEYHLGSEWEDSYFRSTYYDKGLTPEEAWRDYTTPVQ